MFREPIGEHPSSLLALRGREAMVYVVRREQPEPDVMMLGVVPVQQIAAATACVLGRTEAVRVYGELPGPVTLPLHVSLVSNGPSYPCVHVTVSGEVTVFNRT